MQTRIAARTALSTLVAIGLAIGTVAPAAAQSTEQQGQEESVKTDWSDQKLEAFADASVAINEVQAEWRPRIAEAESTEEQQQARQKANQAVQQVIKDEGLSLEEYDEIYKAAQQDRELYSDLMARIEEERGN